MFAIHTPTLAALVRGGLLLGLLLGAAARAQQVAPAPAVTPERLAELLAGGEPRDVVELQAMQDHVQQLAQKVLPATVSLPGASGVLVERDGETFVLCAAHVTEEAGRNLRIRLESGRTLRGTSLGADHVKDVSLIRVQSSGPHPTVEIGRSADLQRGQWVLMLGHPSGLKPERSAPVRLGRVLRVPETGYLVTDCTMQGGDSGGPLFDMQGRVVGINSRIDGNLARNMHAPVDAITGSWQELLDGKVTQASPRRGRASLGLGAPLTFGDGAPVFGEVPADSAAAKAGLRAGDRLFEVGDAEVSDRRSVSRELRRLGEGAEVRVLVYRDGQGIELTLRVEREGGR
ncbi:MAG: trypsin-like peptidase domain-containing protein [Planctomycetota bacterium]